MKAQDLTTLETEILITVTGGAGEQSNVNVGVNVPTKAGPVQIGVQGSNSRSDWAKCADTVKSMGGTPSDLLNACGRPPGNPAPAGEGN